MTSDRQMLDRSSIKFNQIGIVSLCLLGYILNQLLVPAFVAVVLLAGTLNPAFALFKQTYAHVVRPLGLMKSEPVEDIRLPHEFAQFLGGLVLLAGTLFQFAGWPRTGWVLTWIVIMLAAANLFLGFCAGCFLYYQLRKLGVPGFRPQPERGGESADRP